MKILKLSGKAKRNQNGFTLIELIVTLAIFSIILAVAGNYLYFGNNLFAQTEVKNTQKYIGDSVLICTETSYLRYTCGDHESR